MIDKSDSRGLPAPISAAEVLCSNLSQGLHAAAQPLAILRASLGDSRIDRMSEEELRELAATTAIEVERVCTLFSCLQQLVSIECVKPHLIPTAALPLLAQAVDGVNLLFVEDGMSLNALLPEACPPVIIDTSRTQQALSSVLLVAHGVSRGPDTVELIASTSGDALRVVIRNLNSRVDCLNAEARLSMAMAGANIRSQRGDLSWTMRPFTVQIEFQNAPCEGPC